MPENVKLTVFIPGYQEAENLKILLPRLVKTLVEVEPACEILVIDTAKPLDDTESVCKSIGGAIVHVRQSGNTPGDAFKTAIKLARGEYFISMDGDGSHEPAFIKQLYAEKGNYDVVIASRYVAGGATRNSKAEVLMSQLLNLAYARVLNFDCKDISSGFKLYRVSSLKALKLKSEYFDLAQEILYKLKKSNPNLKIKELPFVFKTRMSGKSTRNLPLLIATFISTLIKIKIWEVRPVFKKIYNTVLLRFLFTGFLGVLTNLLVFFLLADIAGKNSYIASIIAFAAATCQNYLLNHHWSFRQVVDYPVSLRAFLKYVAVNLIGLMVNLAVLKIALDLFSPNPKVIAQLAGIALGTAVNYIGAKRFVFLRKALI